MCVHSAFSILLLAVSTSGMVKIQRIPSQVWINLGVCLLAVVLVVRLWRGLKKLNDFAPWFVLALSASTIMSYWTYERTEPQFLTPVVERLTLFLPTKAKHQADLEKLRQSRDADVH